MRPASCASTELRPPASIRRRFDAGALLNAPPRVRARFDEVPTRCPRNRKGGRAHLVYMRCVSRGAEPFPIASSASRFISDPRACRACTRDASCDAFPARFRFSNGDATRNFNEMILITHTWGGYRKKATPWKKPIPTLTLCPILHPIQRFF